VITNSKREQTGNTWNCENIRRT